MVASDEGATHSPPMKNRSACCTGAVVALAALMSCLLRAEAEGQVLDAAVDDRAQPVHRSGDLERLEAGEQVAEDGLELDPRHVGAHAEVLAEAESQVGGRPAGARETARGV